MKPGVPLIAMALAISAAGNAPAQNAPTNPAELADWVLSDMTCFQFLTISDDGDDIVAGSEFATLIAFAYMRGVDRGLDLDPGTSLFQATVNCLGQPELPFSDAPFNPG